MFSRTRTHMAMLIASLTLLAGGAVHSANAGLVLQEVINNATSTPVPGTSMSEQWRRNSSAFDNPKIDNAGNLFFSGALNVTGSVTNGNFRGVWYGGPGTLQLIARDGNVATTLPNPNNWQLNNGNVTTAGLQSGPTLSPNGTMLITGFLFGTNPPANGVNNSAFWTGQPGNIGLVAQRGVSPGPNGVAPGTGGLLWNASLIQSQTSVNNSGQTLFQSTLLAKELTYLTTLAGDGFTATATTPAPHGYAVGTKLIIAGASVATFNGTFDVASVPTTTTFTYAYPGLVRTVTSLVGNGTTVTGTTSIAHGFSAGNIIVIAGASPAGYNGTVVLATASGSTFTYANTTMGASSGTISATLTPALGTITASTGKVSSLIGDGATATATTFNAHGYTIGQTIAIAGATQTGFNGAFLVATTPTSNSFTYANATSGTATTTTNIVATSGAITTPVLNANETGLWLGSPSGIQLVVRRNDDAPGIAGDKLDSPPSFGSGLLLNTLGHVAFVNKLKVSIGDATTNNDQVVWTGTPGNLTPVAREGASLPADLNMGDNVYATGDPFTLFSTGGIVNDNTVYYLAKISGSNPPVTTNQNEYVLISYNSGTTPQYKKIYQRGDASGIPNANFGITNFNNTIINNSGTVLLFLPLQNAPGFTDVTTNNDGSIWIKPADQPAIKVAREGDLINLPDLPADAIFTGVPNSGGGCLNSAGQVVFSAQFSGTGITIDNNRAVFAWDPVGGLMLVAQNGLNYGFVTAATQITPTTSVHYNGEGSCSGLNDNGYLPMIVGNSNTSNYGLYVTRIVAQGACCMLDGTCAMTTQANCAVGNFWRSDLTTCPMTCPPIGKCCYIDGTCAVRFQENCTGTSWTVGQDCSVPCPVPGACCDAITGACSFVPQSLCLAAGNTWTEAVTCANAPCLGSCCDLNYGSCMSSLKIDCPASPTKIWTLGQSCNSNPCTQPLGACCMNDGTCQQMTPPDCTAAGSLRWTTGACGTCPGKPTLIKTGLTTNTGGLSQNGQTVVAALFHGDTQTSGIHKYVRGTGYTTLNGEYVTGALRCTDNATVVSSDQRDATNTSGLSPALNRTLAKRYTAAGGTWNFLGAVGVPTATSGAAANACDFTINSNDGMSDDGRFIAASGWSTSCGGFRVWQFDSNGAGTWVALPRSATGTADRAYSMSGDGLTLVGWDQSGQYRNAAVWTFTSGPFGSWNVTVLDSAGTGSEIYGVNNNGTAIVGYMSSAGMQTAFGSSARTPIRWTRAVNGSTWTRTNLGGVDGMIPIAVSNDGNTIVGVGGTASDAWIWKPHMAAPTDLGTYLTSTGVDLASLGITFGAPLSRGVTGMSRDGTVLLGTYQTTSTPCLTTGGGVLINLNGTGVTCEPPRLTYQPASIDYNTYNVFGGVLNCLNGGSLNGVDNMNSVVPMTFQWQKQDPTDPMVWTDLVDDNCSNFDFFLVKGSQGPQLRLGMWNQGPNSDLSQTWGTYRCKVTNACGTVTTNPATLRMGGACCFTDGTCRILFPSNSTPTARGCLQEGGTYRGDNVVCDPYFCPRFVLGDMNCDNRVDGMDIQDMVQAVFDNAAYISSHPDCDILRGDFYGDFVVDGTDIDGFVNALINQ